MSVITHPNTSTAGHRRPLSVRVKTTVRFIEHRDEVAKYRVLRQQLESRHTTCFGSKIAERQGKPAGGPVRPAPTAQVSACDYEFPEFFESIARIFPGGPILIGNQDFPENSVFRVDRFSNGIPTNNHMTWMAQPFRDSADNITLAFFDKSKAWTFFGLPFEEPPMRVCDFAQQPPRLNVIVDRGTRRELRFRLGDFPHMV